MEPVKPTATSLKDETVLLEWSSPARPFQTRSKEFYKTALALVILVAILLFFIGEFMLIGGIFATCFVIYVLSTVPPENIKHKITRLGIETAGHFHKWEEMYEFWFDIRAGQKMVVIRLLLGFPSHLSLLLGDISEEKIHQLLAERLPYREKPERTFLDNASDWLARKIPLEKAT